MITSFEQRNVCEGKYVNKLYNFIIAFSVFLAATNNPTNTSFLVVDYYISAWYNNPLSLTQHPATVCSTNFPNYPNLIV